MTILSIWGADLGLLAGLLLHDGPSAGFLQVLLSPPAIQTHTHLDGWGLYSLNKQPEHSGNLPRRLMKC